MNKFEKTLSIIGLLLVMLASFTVIVFYQRSVQLPFFLRPLSSYPIAGDFIAEFLFWLGAALFVICLIILLIVLFYPKSLSAVKFQKSHGTLTINNAAIKGFVESIVNKYEFTKKPKIKVHLTKHKLKIRINGELKRTSELYGKSELLSKEIRNELKQLIGVKQNIVIDVAISGYAQEEPEPARVV